MISKLFEDDFTAEALNEYVEINEVAPAGEYLWQGVDSWLGDWEGGQA
ncbi:MAG: hypothetical protein AB7K68_16980 [Bacteriovoracia bacterium]